MAGKTTSKQKIKKEEPDMSNTYIDDIILRIGIAEDRIGRAEDDIADVLKSMESVGINELAMRVEKVEARLGIG